MRTLTKIAVILGLCVLHTTHTISSERATSKSKATSGVSSDLSDETIEQAVQRGNLEALQTYFASKTEFSERRLASLLHLAARAGQEAAVRLLIQKGASVDAKEYEDAYIPLPNWFWREPDPTVREMLEMDREFRKEYDNGYIPLHSAVWGGHEPTVSLLLEEGKKYDEKYNASLSWSYWAARASVRALVGTVPRIDTKDKRGLTALHHAVKLNGVAIVRLLCKSGAQIEARTNIGSTPLHLAAETGNEDVMILLLEYGANLAAVDSQGAGPLHYAARNRRASLASFLLEKGLCPKAKDQGGQMPIHWAAKGGNTEIVRLLIAKGAGVEEKDNDENVPVHWAAIGGNVDVVLFLLDLGNFLNQPAMVDVKNKAGCTPLHLAAENNNGEVLKIFLAKSEKNDWCDSKGELLAIGAATKGHAGVMRVLFENTPKARKKEIKLDTLAHLAAIGGHTDVLRVLCEQDVSIVADDSSGNTPLHLAANEGHVQAVEFLLEQNHYTEVSNKVGRKPLHLAAKKCHRKVVELLLRKGADVEALDQHTCTPLFYAAKKGDDVIVNTLLEAGARVDIKMGRGCTALDWPAHLGSEKHAAIVETLLAAGAKAAQKNEAGFSPLHYAAIKEHQEIVKSLLTWEIMRCELFQESKVRSLFWHVYNKFKELEFTDVQNSLESQTVNINFADHPEYYDAVIYGVMCRKKYLDILDRVDATCLSELARKIKGPVKRYCLQLTEDIRPLQDPIYRRISAIFDGNTLQDRIDTMLNDAPKKCAQRYTFSENDLVMRALSILAARQGISKPFDLFSIPPKESNLVKVMQLAFELATWFAQQNHK